MVLSDQIHFARDVEKRNTTALDTFESPSRGPAGPVVGSAVTFFARPATTFGESSVFSIDDVSVLPKFEIVYAYANMGRDFIDLAVRTGAKGIVVAGVGDGNMTTVAVDGLQDAVKAGVAVVRAAAPGAGRLFATSSWTMTNCISSPAVTSTRKRPACC